MALVSALRGDSLSLRYAGGSPLGDGIGASLTADATVLGGSRIALTGGTAKHIFYESRSNLFDGRAFTLALRVKANYAGSPSATYAYISLGLPTTATLSISLHHHTTGQLRIHVVNEAGTVLANESSFGAWSPTSGTEYDIVITSTGTTTSNGTRCYIDGSLLGQVTLGGNLSASLTSRSWRVFGFGLSSRASNTDISVVEFAAFDSIEDPTSVALVGGNGSLNGESRTALIDAAAFDGSSQTVINTISNTTLTPVGPLAAILEEV